MKIQYRKSGKYTEKQNPNIWYICREELVVYTFVVSMVLVTTKLIFKKEESTKLLKFVCLKNNIN